MIALKESGDSVLAADCHTLHELIIGELEEVFGFAAQTAWLDSFFVRPAKFLWEPNQPAPIHISITQLQHFAGEFYFSSCCQFPRLRGHTLGCGAVGNCGEMTPSVCLDERAANGGYSPVSLSILPCFQEDA